MSDVNESTILAFGSLPGAGVISVLEDSNHSAFSHILCRVMNGMVSIPQSSALTLRLLDELAEDEDATDGAVFGTREVANVNEAVPLLEMAAESKSLTIFFLWAGVIFD